MTAPTIGFAGMTHLGLVSAVAAAERGFTVTCFDPDSVAIAALSAGELPVSEPDLAETLERNSARISFAATAEALERCDVVYVAPDVATDAEGASDLSGVDGLLDLVDPHLGPQTVLVVLSQVPPGYTRGRARAGRTLFYQVETLIFGRALARALEPERFIIGGAAPDAPLPDAYHTFLSSFGCPILAMRYESAELAKIAINCCLVSSISVANTLAELCEGIGADWSEIVPALKLDRRIGEYAYLNPGLGIAGGNLERDLATVCQLAGRVGSDAGVVEAWTANSRHRKLAAVRMLEDTVLCDNPDPLIAIWGLAYKENTNSTRNSPALATIDVLKDHRLRLHDPVVSAAAANHPAAAWSDDPLEAASGADVLMILTPWQDYRRIAPEDIARIIAGRVVIDPYGVLDGRAAREAGLNHVTLGLPAAHAEYGGDGAHA